MENKRKLGNKVNRRESLERMIGEGNDFVHIRK